MPTIHNHSQEVGPSAVVVSVFVTRFARFAKGETCKAALSPPALDRQYNTAAVTGDMLEAMLALQVLQVACST